MTPFNMTASEFERFATRANGPFSFLEFGIRDHSFTVQSTAFFRFGGLTGLRYICLSLAQGWEAR